jgi:hypothetical protein
MIHFKFLTGLMAIVLASCLPVHVESQLEAVAPPASTKDLMTCSTMGGWDFALATSEANLFLIYKKDVSFGVETKEGTEKQVLSPISKFIHLGEVVTSKVAPKSIALKTKLGPAEKSTDSFESDEPSEVEFRKIETYVKGQASIEIDFKDPASKGKIGIKGTGQALNFESPFLVCSGPIKIMTN